jgi:hypothetical protein
MSSTAVLIIADKAAIDSILVEFTGPANKSTPDSAIAATFRLLLQTDD